MGLTEELRIIITGDAQDAKKAFAAINAEGRKLQAFGKNVRQAIMPGFTAIIAAAGTLAFAIGGTMKNAYPEQWQQITDALSKFSEVFSTSLAPVMQPLADALSLLAATVLPYFAQIVQMYVVPAIQAFADWLQKVIASGTIQSIFEWIVANGEWLGKVLMGVAIAFGAMMIISQVITVVGTLMTLFNPLGLLLMAIGVLVALLVTQWDKLKEVSQNISGIMTGLWTLLKIKLCEGLMAVWKVIANFVKPIFSAFAQGLEWIVTTFNNIVGAIKDVINWFKRLGDSIPKSLIPGSPTPFEMGLRGINQELDKLTGKTLPRLTGGISFSTTGGAMNAQNAQVANEMYGIRDEIRFLVRTLPRAIANATA